MEAEAALAPRTRDRIRPEGGQQENKDEDGVQDEQSASLSSRAVSTSPFTHNRSGC